jgi:chromosome segregation ATPase
MSRKEPIHNTCPDIDRAIASITSTLEDLRSDNATLRAWGNEMADEAEGFETALDEANNTIDELKSKIEDLESEVEALKYEVKEMS